MAAVTTGTVSNRRGKYSKQRSCSDIECVERVTHRQIVIMTNIWLRILVRQLGWQFKISNFSKQEKQQQEKQKAAKTQYDSETKTQFNLCSQFWNKSLNRNHWKCNRKWNSIFIITSIFTQNKRKDKTHKIQRLLNIYHKLGQPWHNYGVWLNIFNWNSCSFLRIVNVNKFRILSLELLWAAKIAASTSVPTSASTTTNNNSNKIELYLMWNRGGYGWQREM